MNIGELLEGTEQLRKMQEIKHDYEEKVRIEAENKERKHIDNLKKYCFKNKDEMLVYLRSGKRITERYGYPEEGLKMEGDKICYTYMVYSEIDMPIGYSKKYYTEEEFMNNERMYRAWDHGYDPTWVKNVTDFDEDF